MRGEPMNKIKAAFLISFVLVFESVLLLALYQ